MTYDKYNDFDSTALFLKKLEQSRMLRIQLVAMFRKWDSEVGKESDLNCLDISTAVHRSICQYLDDTEKRLNREV